MILNNELILDKDEYSDRKGNLIEFTLFGSQVDFVYDMETKYTAFVGGFRSGKTYALMAKAVILAANNPNSTGALCLPTLGMGTRTRQEWEDFLYDHNVHFERLPSVNGYNLFFNGVPTRILLLSSENFLRARNLELSFFALDESDAMVGTRAWDAWNLFISRLSGGKIRRGYTVSTPEGYGFMHNVFEQQIEDKPELLAYYKLYRGSTYDNPTLPDDYIPSILATYTPQLAKAYLHGEFVNLTQGAVYVNYDPKLNTTDKTYNDLPSGAELHIGMDFNNNAMSAVTFYCDSHIHMIHEIMDSKNTQSMITAIKYHYPGNKIFIYPDASGIAGKTSASSSDIAQLKAAGFIVKAFTKNPQIKNRVNSVNALFENSDGDRRLLVNKQQCKTVHRCLLKQVYTKDGAPLKDNIVDGPMDAMGYFCYYNWPLQGKNTIRVI